jgi:tRNA-Thr(GGU) m(6)t(6)A37 methyltransferase TsaA
MIRSSNQQEEFVMSEKKELHQSFSVFTVGSVQVSEMDGFFAVKLLPEFREAMEGLDQFQHVIVLWWADRQDSPQARHTLLTELPYAPGIQAGVFACRSEYRPNPIGITISQILEIDKSQGIVRLAWIDAFDGTPVLDLKPYLPVSDRVRDVSVADWMKDWPVWMEDAGEYFASNPTNFGE